MGRFIVLDGIDGCGKSTQAERVAEELSGRGRTVLHLREPGGTAVGEHIREILLGRGNELSSEVETLLFCASRRQLLDQRVAPALAEGCDVVCERFHPSTFAYQAFAGDLDEERVLELLATWAGEPRPDLTCVLDLAVEESARRRGAASDRFEDRGLGFQRRVAEGYRRYVARTPGCVLIDASGAPEQVTERILAAIVQGAPLGA
jgi:dTMP kinase